jgi:branched-chain amino acid transport system substrate-binding protein
MAIYGPGSPGWYEPHVIKALDKLILYAFVNVPWINPNSPVYQKADAAFMKAHNAHLDTNTAYAYTGMLVLADAIERAGSTKADDIVAALKKTDFKDHPVVGGPIKFAPNGDNTGALTALIQVNTGALTALIQVQPDPDYLKRVKVALPKEFAQAKDYTFPAPQLWERG